MSFSSSTARDRAKRLSVTIEGRQAGPGAPPSTGSRRGSLAPPGPPLVSRATSFQVPKASDSSLLARRPGAPLSSASFQGVPRTGENNEHREVFCAQTER